MKKNILILFAAALVFCACGTTKKVATEPVAQTTKPVQSSVNQFVSNLDVSIAFGQDHFDLDGKLSARRDDVLRINLSYMGFIEVATIEFTPDYMLFINRMGKQYTKVGYNDFDVFVKNNITFNAMQQEVWAKFDASKGMKFDDEAFSKSLENLFNSNTGGANKASIKIKIGQPDTKREVASRTEIKSSYKQIPADVLIKGLSGMMK